MSAKTTRKTKPISIIIARQTPNRPLLTDVRQMILQAREGVARAVDSGLTTLYWSVGQRIRQDILKEKREIVSALLTQLEGHLGRGEKVNDEPDR